MIDRLLDFLSGRAAPQAAASADELQHAVAALLIEASRMDNHFDATERATINRLLGQRFQLEPKAINSLIASAEEAVRHSTQYFQFTQTINVQLSGEERVQIIEMLWNAVYADGVLDPYEDMLLRRIAGLIHVSDVDRGLARQRALNGLGLQSS
jgi:uncharacterized tellurite resistance protein B-like protein